MISLSVPFCFRCKSESGFSLLELIVALAIAAILASVAAPAFRNMIIANRIESQANLFATSVALARSEALKGSSRASLCASNDGATCSGGWSDGWIVFTDADGNAGALDGTDRIIKAFDGAPEDYTMAAGNGLATSLTFLSSGELDSAGGSLTTCGPKKNADLGIAVFINAVGRPRVSRSIDNCG
jgi:type IV fimbrial biogenesis protein FimT